MSAKTEDVSAAIALVKQRAEDDYQWADAGHAAPSHAFEMKKHARAVGTILASHAALVAG